VTEYNDRRANRTRLFTLFLLLFLSLPLSAQVGHEPRSSPYRDLRIKQTITGFGGYLWGGYGKAGVGPGDGPLAGIRWDVHLGGFASLFLGGSYSDLERVLLDPSQPPETRVVGTTTQGVTIIDGGANLLLTGRKTWHGLMPYIGAATGIALGGSVPEDSLTNYTFNTKFHFGPTGGFRFFLSRRLHLRAEGRVMFWKLSYPNVFFQPGVDPIVPPILDPTTNSQSEWVTHLTLMIGLGYTLRI
jgi:hypothetical protein